MSVAASRKKGANVMSEPAELSPKKKGSPVKKKPLFYAGSRPETKDSIRMPPTRGEKSSRSGTAASKRSTQSDETSAEDLRQAPPPQDESAKSVTKPSRKLTGREVEMEAKICLGLEDKIEGLKRSLRGKQIIFDKLAAELLRMLGVFERLKKMGETRGTEIVEAEQSIAVQGLTHLQRKELLEKGPFNLVFHGIKPDWIEDEMDDDPEFKRDVLEQKIRTLIREECGLLRDVGIIDVYRHKEGAPLHGAYPVVVQFKARREKEQIMWRAKEKLRNSDIVVTEDSQQRLLDLMKLEAEKMKKEGGRAVPASPVKARTRSQSPVKAMGSPIKKSSSLMSFSYSAAPPSHLQRSPSKNALTTKQRTSTKARHESFNTFMPPTMIGKSGLTSDDDEDEFDLMFQEEEEEYHDDLLDDFPEVPKASTSKKSEVRLPPESPQKSLFEDFMF